jgi:DNA-binding transcriptional LysR family regulator
MASDRELREVKLTSLDFTQLRVLDTLFRERSVRQTAERLHLTSSAISHALNRLRQVIGDELFIRQPEGMIPTQRAIEIAPRLKEALEMLQASFAVQEFDPAECRRTFVIACVPYVAQVYLPMIVPRLVAEAPKASFRLRLADNGLVSDLEANHVDLALAIFGRLPETFCRKQVWSEDFVIAISREHPLAAGEHAIVEFLEWPHVEVQLDGSDGEALDAYQVKAGLERKVVMSNHEFWQGIADQHGVQRQIAAHTPDSASALAMIAGSNMVGMVAASAFRQSVHREKLKIVVPPMPPKALELELVWHSRKQGDFALSWLRQRLSEVPPAYDAMRLGRRRS